MRAAPSSEVSGLSSRFHIEVYKYTISYICTSPVCNEPPPFALGVLRDFQHSKQCGKGALEIRHAVCMARVACMLLRDT